MTLPRPLGIARLPLLAAWLLAGAVAWAPNAAPAAEPDDNEQQPAFAPADVEFFEKKVRPLLAARCQECHGPEQQKGNLRLDARSSLLQGGDTAPAIVPGKPDESLLVDAIRYGDIYQMPPDSRLPAEEVETLVEWVRRGAPWGAETAPAGPVAKDEFDLPARSQHWCFQPLSDATPPAVRAADWLRTPVDRFILARLEAAGLSPAPEADKRTLLRRLTFDLTGLPPTPAELERFLADESPAAYAMLVERLLASPRYGERWARHWLDLVRYAETHGHEFDFEIPNAYRYRDYVIRALNADLPFDEFVVEHVAGDLLQAPRRHPRTGFNESIIGTGWFFFGEAKHSPVDVRGDEADRIDNQIDVFAKTFLGLTVSCARCHDHKFDAISTRDYYALAGYLQSSRYQQAMIDPPASRAGAISQLRELRERLADDYRQYARAELLPGLSRLAERMTSGEFAAGDKARKRIDDVLHPWAVLVGQPDVATAETSGESFSTQRIELAARLREADQAADESIVFADFQAAPSFDLWRTAGEAFGTRPGRPLEWALVDGPDGLPAQLLTAGAAHSGLLATKLQGALRSPTFEITEPNVWYRVYGNGGRVRLVVDGLQLIRNPIYGGLEFKPKQLEPYWHKMDVSKWIGHKAYVELLDDGDGYLALEKVNFSAGGPPAPRPNRLVAETLADASLTSKSRLATAYAAAGRHALSAWLDTPDGTDAHDADGAALIRAILVGPLHPNGPEALTQAASETPLALARRRSELESALEPPRRAPALADGSAENERVFIRGNHKTLGGEVERRFLEVLGGTAHAAPDDGSGRLSLARQLVANPLLPRVVVNRLWHHHFGTGIVRTPDDFGVMGQPPTHPQLLDYLAHQLIRSDWSLKHLHRQIVLSAAYRMSSRPRPKADLADPENKLWHRRDVRRLEAESIRDAILAVSTRADTTMYGPGVMPHLTEFMAGRGRPGKSGPLDGNGRRSIYQAVRRNFLPPMFLAFDYPTPFTTIGRRGVSNVPAQALAMMNNPFVLGQARHWADALLADGSASGADRVRTMYLTALSRLPADAELAAAIEFVDATAAESDQEQAWTELAHVLFNVKEFIFIP